MIKEPSRDIRNTEIALAFLVPPIGFAILAVIFGEYRLLIFAAVSWVFFGIPITVEGSIHRCDTYRAWEQQQEETRIQQAQQQLQLTMALQSALPCVDLKIMETFEHLDKIPELDERVKAVVDSISS